MGNGLAEVVLLAGLTIIVLPCFFFALLALLDRFERNLDPGAQTPPQLVAQPVPAGTDSQTSDEPAGADVVALPVAVPVAEAPAAATG